MVNLARMIAFPARRRCPLPQRDVFKLRSRRYSFVLHLVQTTSDTLTTHVYVDAHSLQHSGSDY
eukprot:3837366-Pleurochrysis_carterae.AAC.2